MKLKKVNKNPFSNGTEFMIWTNYNCDRCWKQQPFLENEQKYGKFRCSIQRDIITRMFTDKPIKQAVIDICAHKECPYKKERRKYYKKKNKFLLKQYELNL